MRDHFPWGKQVQAAAGDGARELRKKSTPVSSTEWFLYHNIIISGKTLAEASSVALSRTHSWEEEQQLYHDINNN